MRCRRPIFPLGLAAVAVLMAACSKQEAAPAPRADAPASAQVAAAPAGKLPFADFTDDQLVDRWNRQTQLLQLPRFALSNCKPEKAPDANTTIFSCPSAHQSSVFFVRTGGKVTKVQFVSMLNIASMPLDLAAKIMVRFLHDGVAADDGPLYGEFTQKASRSTQFCLPDAPSQSQICYLTHSRRYAVEVK